MSELAHITETTHTEDFESCKCPEGFTGLRCEIKVETCPEGDHLCLFGSTCERVGNNYTCDCDVETTEKTRFAGMYCQHKSTSLCTVDGMLGSGKNKNAFCVSNGKCLKLVGEDEE